MVQVLEINQIEQLSQFRHAWGELLHHTAGGAFFHSLEWLEIYWRHYGQRQKLRVLVVLDDDRPTGIVPLTVRSESTRLGRFSVLTYPLHDWGSFYGPIGSEPVQTLAAALKHIQNTPRAWDLLELRWLGAPGTDPALTGLAMREAGFQAYQTLWDRAAVVDLAGTWQSYWSSRNHAWLQRYRHLEQKLTEQSEISFMRYRPLGLQHDDGSPRWDLYDLCEEISQRSWQGSATNGTTLSHESVRSYFRETHQAAAVCGALDLCIMSIDGSPAAFLYNYHHRGYVYGLRRGQDIARSPKGAGHLLLAYALRDSFDRGDRLYDLGVGSLEGKRRFQTRLLPIFRCSHFACPPIRLQLLRLKRWWQSRRTPASIAVGCARD